MNFKPLNDRILLKINDSEEKSAGGIIIPDSAQEKPMKGQVVAVGTGKVSDSGKVTPLEVKAGQSVFFRKYAGTEVSIDGVEHMIMREDEILAIVE